MSLAIERCNTYLLMFLRTGNPQFLLARRHYSVSNPEQWHVREIAL